MGDFGRLHKKLDQIEKDLQDAATAATRADPRDMDSMDVDVMLNEKKTLEDQLDELQGELERLEGDRGSVRSRTTRASSPGELYAATARGRCSRPCKPRRCAPPAPPPPRNRSSGSNNCRCCCNTNFLGESGGPMMISVADRMLQQVRSDLEDATGQKLTMQERIAELEDQKNNNAAEQEELQRMLDDERERLARLEDENAALQDQIQRLEMELANLPMGDCGSMREASIQISQLLHTLNEDMAKTPELCSRLRMAAQQIIDVEKRCANERGARSNDQQEVQFLRTENQRLREQAFKANMSAFQATVQVPPQAMMQQQQQPQMQQQMSMAPGASYGGAGSTPRISIYSPSGAINPSNGSINPPNGSINPPNGSIYPQNGSMYPHQGSIGGGYPAGGSFSGYPPGGSISGYPPGGSISGYPPGGSISGYPGGQEPGRRRTLKQRMFRRSQDSDGEPVALQYQDGKSVIFDPAMTMQQQRLSMAMMEDPDEAAKRVQMLNQDKRRGCCGK